MGKVILEDESYEIDNPEMKFTDRDNPRKVFWEAYDALGRDEFFVINYYGFGGIGKSWLCKHLCSALKDGKHPFDGRDIASKTVILNFEDLKQNCSQVPVLENLSNKLEAECGYKFPLFKYGLYVYYRTQGYSNDSPEIGRIQDNVIGAALLDAVGMVPVVGAIGSILLKGADTLSVSIRNKVMSNSEYIKNLDSLNAEEITGELLKIFVKELREQTLEEKDPVVIFFDTYEQMQNYVYNTESAKVSEEWLYSRMGLIRRIPNVLWVIAGQRRVNWADNDLYWRNSEDNDGDNSIIYEEIAEISDHDLIRNMLMDIGISEQPIADMIVKKTNGVPVHLALCKDIYFNMKRDGKEPQAEDFDMGYSQLAGRFIGGLSSQLRDIVETLACLDSWTDEDIQYFNLSPNSYRHILQLSFISGDGERYYMHNSVKDIVIRDCSKLVIQKCLDYFGDCIVAPDVTQNDIKDYVCKIINLRILLCSRISSVEERLIGIKEVLSFGEPYLQKFGTDYSFFKRIKQLLDLIPEEEQDFSFIKMMDVFSAYHLAQNGRLSELNAFVASRNIMIGHTKMDPHLRGILYLTIYRASNIIEDFASAKIYLLECLDIFRAENDVRLYLETLFNLGRICGNLRQFDEMDKFSDMGLDMVKELSLQPVDTDLAVSICELYSNKCKVARQSGNFKDAINYLQEAEKILSPFRDRDNERILYEYAVVYQQYIFIYQSAGRYDLRQKYALESLKLSERAYDIAPTDLNQRSLAIAYKDVAKTAVTLEEKKDYIDKALSIYEEIYKTKRSANSITDYCRMIDDAADMLPYAESKPYLDMCREFIEKEGDNIKWKERFDFIRSEIIYYFGIHENDLAIRKLKDCEVMLEGRRERLKGVEYLQYVTWCLREYSIIFKNEGDIYSAIRYYEKENAIQRRMYTEYKNDMDGEAYAASCMALYKLYRDKGLYSKALVYAKKQIELEEEKINEFNSYDKMIDLIRSYLVLGETYDLLRDKEAALDAYDHMKKYSMIVFNGHKTKSCLWNLLVSIRETNKYYLKDCRYSDLREDYLFLYQEYKGLIDSGNSEEMSERDYGGFDYVKFMLGKLGYLVGDDPNETKCFLEECRLFHYKCSLEEKELLISKLEMRICSEFLKPYYPTGEEKMLLISELKKGE
jgi:tetratricopeptide (TPR) repeat protein